MKRTPWEESIEVRRKSAKACGAVMMAFSPAFLLLAIDAETAGRAVGMAALAIGSFLAGLYQWRRRQYLIGPRYWKRS
jgi:hypothetical protein